MFYNVKAIAILFLLHSTGRTVSLLSYSQMTQFLPLTSVDGYNACPNAAIPFKSYSVDSVGCCAFDCKILSRRTTSSVPASSCVGFNYLEKNHTCQLFIDSQQLNFVPQPNCNYFMNVAVVGPQPSIPVCPRTFTFNSSVNGCYKVMLVNKEWSSASQTCASLVPGGHLAFINSSAEQTAIQTLLSSSSASGCNVYSGLTETSWFIGGQYFDPSASLSPFYWKVDESTPVAPVTYANWGPNNPDLPGNEICMSVAKTMGYRWNTVTCTGHSLCFICQLSL